MNILMVASEATPFAKTGGLADVLGGLPPALAARGENVAVVIPAYRENHYPAPPARGVSQSLDPPRARITWPISIRPPNAASPIYFVHCPLLYDRDGIYGSGRRISRTTTCASPFFPWPRSAWRATLFRPNIIHAHDWQAALAPVYSARTFPEPIPPSSASRPCSPSTISAIRDLPSPGASANRRWTAGFQSRSAGIFRQGQFPERRDRVERRRQHRQQRLRAGDPNARIRLRSGRIPAPSTAPSPASSTAWITRSGTRKRDVHIARNYSANDLSGKRECKRALLKRIRTAGLDLDRPLAGIISRFAAQKGFDLFAEIASRSDAGRPEPGVLWIGRCRSTRAMFRDSGARAIRIKWDCGSGYDTDPLAPHRSRRRHVSDAQPL